MGRLRSSVLDERIFKTWRTPRSALRHWTLLTIDAGLRLMILTVYHH